MLAPNGDLGLSDNGLAASDGVLLGPRSLPLGLQASLLLTALGDGSSRNINC